MRPTNFLKWAVAIFAGAALLVSCAKEEVVTNSADGPTTLEQRYSGTQTLYEDWSPAGGPEAECELAGGGCGYAWKIEDGEGLANGTFSTGSPDANITIYNYNGTSFSWTSDLEVCKVIVKAATSAYVYDYGSGVCGDDMLVSPTNPNNGQPYEISHITFCYSDVSCYNGPCYEEETAWTQGPRYTARGSWAMYTAYSGQTMMVPIIAGRVHNAGYATLSPEGSDVRIDIDLFAPWEFNSVPENIKVQDYDFAPSGNPSPGLFDHKATATGSSWSIVVPNNSFYGIHLDVTREVPCQ